VYRRRDSKAPPEPRNEGDSAAIVEVKGDDDPQSGAANPAIPGSLDTNLDASDVVEIALAEALTKAAAAGRFDVVGQIARELEARRLSRTGVTVLERHRLARNG
jgi:hypothetical protein